MARIAVGTWFLVRAFQIGAGPIDIVVGPVAANAVIMLALAARGRDAPPLRMTGPWSHVANLAVGVTMLNVFDAPALLFAGSAMLLAAARSYGGCEILAVSNWLRRRDDQFACPYFLPFDLIDQYRATGTFDPSCASVCGTSPEQANVASDGKSRSETSLTGPT